MVKLAMSERHKVVSEESSHHVWEKGYRPNDGGVGKDNPPRGPLNAVWSPKELRVQPSKPAGSEQQQPKTSDKDKND